MEIAGDDIKTYAMDHHGLVAAVWRKESTNEWVNEIPALLLVQGPP